MTTLQKVMTTLTLVVVARAEATLTTSESWGFGFLTGFGLSLIGFVAALLLIALQKCFTQGCFKIFVKMLYALACGALIGDAMVHILPEAFMNESTNKKYVSLIFICAIAFFIILERLFKAFGITHEHWGEDSSHHHEHDHRVNADQPEEEQDKKKKGEAPINQVALVERQKKKSQIKSNEIISSSLIMNPAQTTPAQDNPLGSKNEEATTGSEEKSCLQNLRGKGTAGYLNLLSSFVHNFFDGFGIGVGFASGDMHVITPIIIATFAHEIPRQMGDVGILLKNGFSNVQTVLCNGFINFMSLFGVIAGLGLGSINEQAQNYILVFVAGNFIYIGADIWRHLLANKGIALNIMQFLMFSLGVGAMFLVLLAETDHAHEEE